MSQENVEVVSKVLNHVTAFMDRGDTEEFRKGIARLIDPQAEWHWHDERTIPDVPQDFRGIPELVGFWVEMRSAWADLRAEPLEIIEAPDDRVLTLIRQTGWGRESGVPIAAHLFGVWTIREGTVRNFVLFRHRADALEAAGLSE
jgi:hypothetical protein